MLIQFKKTVFPIKLVCRYHPFSLKEYLLYSLLPDADFNFPQKPGSQSPALLRGFDAEFVDRIFGSHISVPDTPHSKVNHLPVFKETKCQ